MPKTNEATDTDLKVASVARLEAGRYFALSAGICIEPGVSNDV